MFFCMIPSAPFLWNNMFLLLKDQYRYFCQFLVAPKLGIKTGLTESQLLSQGVQKPVFESLRYFLFGIYSVQSLFGISCCSNARVPRSSSLLQVCISSKRVHSVLKKMRSLEGGRKTSMKNGHSYPRGSMGLEHLPTFKIYHKTSTKCRWIYHTWIYGYGHSVPPVMNWPLNSLDLFIGSSCRIPTWYIQGYPCFVYGTIGNLRKSHLCSYFKTMDHEKIR